MKRIINKRRIILTALITVAACLIGADIYIKLEALPKDLPTEFKYESHDNTTYSDLYDRTYDRFVMVKREIELTELKAAYIDYTIRSVKGRGIINKWKGKRDKLSRRIKILKHEYRRTCRKIYNNVKCNTIY